MLLSSLFAACALPLLATAQYGYGGGSESSSTSSAAAAAPSIPADTADHKNVRVGFNTDRKEAFGPNTGVTVKNGTLVTFWFATGGRHSVTQSSFAQPCTALSGGFDSGVTTGTNFTIRVTNETQTIWYFCKVQGHCVGGMVGAINDGITPGRSKTEFQAAALQVTDGTSAGSDEGFKAGTDSLGAVALGAPAAPASTPPPPNGATITSRVGASAVIVLAAASLLL